MNRTKSRILAPVTSGSPGRAAELALSLCVGYGADLQVLNPVVVPEQTPLDHPEERLQAERKTASEVLSLLREGNHGVRVSGSVRVGHRLGSLVVDAASEYNADLLVLDADALAAEFDLGGRAVDRLARNAPCDVVVTTGPGSVDGTRTVLAPVAGGPHSGLVLEVAAALSSAGGAWVEVLHVVHPSASEDDRRDAAQYLDDATAELDVERADSWLLEGDDVADAIVETSEYYDLTVVGAPRRSRIRRFLFGSTTDSVTAESTVPVLVVRRHEE